jgi:predicted nuclease of predicted toxin-antitoxin system
MNFLLDMPVSPTLLQVIQDHGYQGVHAAQIGQHSASDVELLAIARREDRVIITADLDFPRLLALSSERGPGIILFRGGNYSDQEMRTLLDKVLREVPETKLRHSVCVVDKERVRIRLLPLAHNP